MVRYVLKRIFAAILSMFILITATFFLMHAVPGNPFTQGEQKNVPTRVLESLRSKYGLDQPVWRQYISYMEGLLFHGNLGYSFKKLNYTVNELIESGFPVSAMIGFLAIIVALSIGIPLGITAALKRGGWMDWFSMMLATVGVSMPAFVIAVMMMYIFAMKLKLLPVYGYGSARHLVIPVTCLALLPIAYTTRLMRSSMMEISRQDFIRAARARGVREFMVIAKHGVRNSILPVVTYIGPLIAVVMTGNFVVERLF
ncbi:MAG: ABC transporter permease, partial [Synergistaceae bacterium]|nr:ABC transporter permease [Synergistaceae bacterium]